MPRGSAHQRFRRSWTRPIPGRPGNARSHTAFLHGWSRGLRASRRPGPRSHQRQPTRPLRLTSGDLRPRRHPGIHRRPRTTPPGSSTPQRQSPRRLPGTRHARRPLRTRLRLPQRSQDRTYPLLRRRGRCEPVRGGLHSQVRGNRRRPRAHFPDGARRLASPGSLFERVRDLRQSLRRKRNRDLPDARRCVPANDVCRRADLGHQPAGSHGAGGAAQRARPRAGRRHQSLARPHARAPRAVSVGRGALAHRSGSAPPRRARAGGQGGRHPGSHDGRPVSLTGPRHRKIRNPPR